MSSHKSHTIDFDLNERYTVSARLKLICFVLMGVGLVGIALGFIMGTGEENLHRGWANLLVNNLFFLYLGLAGTFFIATQYMANAGWSSGIKRVAEATGSYIGVGGISILLVLGVMLLGNAMGLNTQPIYHWAHHGITDPTSPEFDPVIKNKSGFLNVPFFFAALCIGFAAWTFFTRYMRQLSLREDAEGGIIPFKRLRTASAIYVPVFGVTFCIAVWQIVMSVDPHWFSTIFVFYNFATMFVSGLTAITVTVIFLQKAGYMKGANGNHLHDLGKLMFGLSIFWAYQWISQFLLIWYANLPEEGIYFVDRIYSTVRPLFWANLIINFALPFLVMMTRNAKRQHTTLLIAAGIILCGHWLDIFLMFEVGIMGEALQIGIPEIMTLLGYAGLFIFVVSRSLAAAPVYAKNHPYIKEFAFHQI